jgi:glutaredoxin-related protein
MKVIMYGAGICKDCVQAKELLSNYPQIQLDYRSITDDVKTLKEFLSYRDHEELFTSVREKGSIGIPFFILEDGTKTLEVADIIGPEHTVSAQSGDSCSIDGKGNC